MINQKKAIISVIMPVYNGEQYIEAAIQSVLAQSYSGFEFIIIDDGSIDNTATLVKKYLSDKRIRYYYQSNAGISEARNKGLELSLCEYVAFIDCDDVWMPQKLELQLEALINAPDIALIYNNVTYIDEEDRIIGHQKYSVQENFYKEMLLQNYVDNGSVPLIKKECFDKVGYFNPNISGEDWDMWIRIAKEYKLLGINEYLVKYRIYPKSMSKNYKKMIEGLIWILDREFKDAPVQIWDIKNKAYAYRYFYSFGVARNLLQNKDAFQYLVTALKVYPNLLLEKDKISGILKFIIMLILPKQILLPLRQNFKTLLSMLKRKEGLT